MKKISFTKLMISLLRILIICGFTPLFSSAESGLRINGKVSHLALDDDGNPYGVTNGQYRFQIDIGRNGCWLMQCSDLNDIHQRSAVGYDGTNLLEIRYISGFVEDLENPTNSYSIPLGSGPMRLNIREGDDYPYGVNPAFHFVWYAIIGSHYWTQKTNSVRTPQPLDAPVTIRAYTVVAQPRYRNQWPHLLEDAMLFTDFTDIPKYPPGVPLQTDEEMDANARINDLEFIKRRKSGIKVGSIKTGSEKQFAHWSFPTEFIAELSNYAADGYQKLDQTWKVSKATIETVVEIDRVSGVPEFGVGEIGVNDYRFRKVDESSRVAFLGYTLKDRIIPARDDPNLLTRFGMEVKESKTLQRHGFFSRGTLKNVITCFIFAVFFIPIIRKVLNKITSDKFSVK